MSSNPANTLPPEYDDALPADYDPEFTADISTKMRVPDRISVSQQQNGLGPEPESWAQHSAATMNVPDKIVVMGREERVGLKEDPKLHLDLSYGATGDQPQYVGLDTPPRVLTLEDRPFHANEEAEASRDQSMEWPESKKSRQDTSIPNGYVTPGTKHSSDSLTLEASMSTPGEGLLIQDEQADDIAVLRRQMAKLSRHVMRLEEENSRRSNREIILYPLVFCYFLFQVGKWFVQVK